jgi:GNAT superfamily N-acetyltransferase
MAKPEKILDRTVSPSATPTDFNPASYRVEETVRDGGVIAIRAIRPDDKERLREHARGLSPESVYHRFMFYKRELSDEELRHFTELDFDQHVGIVAILNEEGREHITGIGRYLRTSKERGEAAFSVVDTHQGRGIGTLLLVHLSRIARGKGITEFEADVLGDNVHMLDVVAASGFKVQATHEGGVVHLLMRIDDAQPE